MTSTATRLVATVLVGLFATLLLAGSASAGQLVDENGTWVYRAGPGEANRVRVQEEMVIANPDPNRITIVDEDRTISLPNGCDRGPFPTGDTDVAYCAAKPVRFELGDGDDTATAMGGLPEGLLVTLDGGSGNDTLSGSHTGAKIVAGGGDGNDTLTGSH